MKTVLTLILTFVSTIAQAKSTDAEWNRRPKLVVLMVLDQLRADTFFKYHNRFLLAVGPSGKLGGFRYLIEKGAYFPYAEYGVLQAMTGPGHATLLTGAYPYQHGISINSWYDVDSKKRTYCVGDHDVKIVGAISGSKSAQLGMSPKNLWASTVGDELKNSAVPSRTFAVSLKDRSAILMGGKRADLALWFDEGSLHWVSSNYYLPQGQLPDWMSTWNEQVRKRVSKKADLREPIGVDLTRELAEKVIKEYRMGKEKSVDLLAVSFSTHDYAAHRFGPNSPELEKLTLHEDQAISQFMNQIKAHLGADFSQATFVLTSDHGGPPNPDELVRDRVPSGRILETEAATDLNQFLDTKFGKHKSDEQWVVGVEDFNYYLNPKAMPNADVTLDRVMLEAKAYLEKKEFAQLVFTRADLGRGAIGAPWLDSVIRRTYRTEKNGHVVVVPRPYYMMGGDTVGHMTAHSYDRIVPLIFAGFGIKPGIHPGRADIVDLARTLAWILKVTPPTGAEGRVLTEIL